MPFSFHFTLVRDGKINTREGIVRYKFESSFLDKNEKKKFLLCAYFYICFASKNSNFIYLRDINVYVYFFFIIFQGYICAFFLFCESICTCMIAVFFFCYSFFFRIYLFLLFTIRLIFFLFLFFFEP